MGKTTFLRKLIEELKMNGMSPSGILTPAIYNSDGDKIGFKALNVANGEQWELGRSDSYLDGPSYGPFSFSERGFGKANKILKKVLSKGPSDIFLDEIGPLELEKGYGFFPVLPLISSFSTNRNLYLIIRQSLIAEFSDRVFKGKEYSVIEITMNNRDSKIMY